MSSPLVRSSSTMSNVDTEALFARIHKEQSNQLELLKKTKRAMDKSIAAREANAENDAPSLAKLSFEILSDLLDEVVLEVVTESHREMSLMRSICPICKTKCRNYVHQTGLDIFGQNPQTSNSQTYECVSCQRSYPAQRYAPHLEKCLGLAGRASSRVANRRIGAERAGSGSPFTPLSYSDDREASDSDKDLIEKKRKKNALNGGTGVSNGNNGSSKSSQSSGTKVKKQKVVDSDSQDSVLKNPKSTGLNKVTIHLPGKSKNAVSGDLALSSSSSSTSSPAIPLVLGIGDDVSDSLGSGSSKSSKGSSASLVGGVGGGAGIGEIKLGYLDLPPSSSALGKVVGGGVNGVTQKKSGSSKKSSSSTSGGATGKLATSSVSATQKKKQGGGSSSKKSSGGGGGSGSSSSKSAGVASMDAAVAAASDSVAVANSRQ